MYSWFNQHDKFLIMLLCSPIHSLTINTLYAYNVRFSSSDSDNHIVDF